MNPIPSINPLPPLLAWGPSTLPAPDGWLVWLGGALALAVAVVALASHGRHAWRRVTRVRHLLSAAGRRLSAIVPAAYVGPHARSGGRR